MSAVLTRYGPVYSFLPLLRVDQILREASADLMIQQVRDAMDAGIIKVPAQQNRTEGRAERRRRERALQKATPRRNSPE